MIEQIAASRCPRCAAVVAPPAPYCPRHPIAMTPVALPGIGEVVTFTTLHSPPEGFRSPLHIALVELEEGARFVCHGSETRGLRVGATVAIEAIDIDIIEGNVIVRIGKRMRGRVARPLSLGVGFRLYLLCRGRLMLRLGQLFLLPRSIGDHASIFRCLHYFASHGDHCFPVRVLLDSICVNFVH